MFLNLFYHVIFIEGGGGSQPRRRVEGNVFFLPYNDMREEKISSFPSKN